MSPSVQKTDTRAYLDAKTEAGREKRIAWVIGRLNQNRKLMWQGRRIFLPKCAEKLPVLRRKERQTAAFSPLSSPGEGLTRGGECVLMNVNRLRPA